jgi:Tfp pilus assembly protein PilN
MIRINLLREPVSEKKAITPEVSQIGLYAVILMGLIVAGMGWWYWHLLSQRTTIQGDIAELQQENRRLQVVRAELDKFERQKKLLDERIAVIERLKANQKGPVLLMNALIASIPEDPRVWLNTLVQKERTVTLQGDATDVLSISEFVAKLKGHPPFADVELAYWQREGARVKFELRCALGQ